VRNTELRAFLNRSLEGTADSREIQVGERELVLASHPLAVGGAVTSLLDASEIRRLERVRRDFVANASHELKTPLTSIRGFAETLLEDEDTEPEIRQRFLGAIRNNTLRLQNLVDDLLDLSRLESGGWIAARERVDVGQVAEGAWDALATKLTGDRVFSVSGKGVAYADASGMAQIFRNLFENAVRHTAPGGRIAVKVSSDGQTVTTRVIDDGEGIPLQSLPRIFERFYRADSARDRDQGGTGLGLAIVRHMIHSMGGAVGAESELGGGTTIVMTLPAVPEPQG
jgi:signal transduction histidine kinase